MVINFVSAYCRAEKVYAAGLHTNNANDGETATDMAPIYPFLDAHLL